MRVKEHHRMHQFIRAAKKLSGGPTMIVQLPLSIGDRRMHPGSDRALAAVYAYDRFGILVVEWSKFMRYLGRRHREKTQ
ncbi:MAG: hypothetical protein NXI32_04960 [bacterium]|nr:hypothetical protein [bacterium]